MPASTHTHMIVSDGGEDCIAESVTGAESPQDDASKAVITSATVAASSDIAASLGTE
jgi:hypothetical protein